MKHHIPSFAAGMLTMALIGSLGVGALAVSGQMTISVDPINIQVNGAVFQPKDATGADVPVFAYNSTTYAPLRALAEAYGLEVGYDAESNMATVGKVGETLPAEESATPVTYTFDYSYEEFKGLWDIGPDPFTGDILFIAKDTEQVLSWWASVESSVKDDYLIKATHEEFEKLGDDAPPQSLFKSRKQSGNLASVWPGNDDEVSYFKQTSHESQ